MLLGINSLRNMPRGEDPPFNAPLFFIVAIYPGTSPQDMEELVVKPMEDKLYELDDVKRIITNVNDGVMILRLEFQYGVSINDKKNIVNREVNALRSKLPPDLLSLDINSVQSSDVNILQMGLVSETIPYRQLEDKADILKKDLEKIKALKEVKIHAFPKQEVKISLNLPKMAQNRLGLNKVLGMLQGNNVNIPAGDLSLGEKTFNIKTTADFENLEDIKKTVIGSSANGVIHLQDIAEVNMGYENETHLARYNGKRAIWVTASLKDRKNILQTREKMEVVLKNFEKNLDTNIALAYSFDQAKNVEKRLSAFLRDFAIAIALVLLTLLPLGWRASVVVMISIPLSLAMGLFFLDMLGYTINQLSIVGMVVALGLLVDDSIIVVENIERFLRMGYSRIDASIEATNQIAVAVMGCTAVLVLAFLPLTFLPEGAGDFIRSLPMAVLCTVLASLAVAMMIIPFLSSLLLSSHHSEEGNFFMRAFKKYVNQPYRHILEFSFRYPVVSLLGAFLLFVGSVMLIPTIGLTVFPKSEKPMFLVNITAPLGTNLEESNRIAREVEKKILKNNEIISVSTNVGKGNPRVYYNVAPPENASNISQLFCQTQEMETKEFEHFLDNIRTEIGQVAGAKLEVYQFEQGPPIDAPIAIRVFSENLDTLRALSFKIEDILTKHQGTRNIKNPVRTLKNDISIKINKEKSGRLGVPLAEIARTIRLSIAGLQVGKFRNDEGDEYALNVSLEKNPEEVLNVFGKTYITAQNGALIPLSQLADIQLQTSPSTINHYNKDRFVVITAFGKTGVLTSNINAEIKKTLENFKFPKNTRFMMAGEVESASESFGGLETIILLTVFGLLGILILEFRTFKSTIIVLSVVPLGIVGALFALFLVGKSLSFVAIVGMVALMGIEIKNSILLVDYTNQLREQGKSVDEAIREGAETRFLPILLTSLTAIGGLTPLVIEDAPLYAPLAWVLIGGLISSTLLSRIVTPVLYKLLPPKINVE
jgi:multidrug efflux pump subunit AcrB